MARCKAKPLSCYASILLAVLATFLILLCFHLAKKHHKPCIPSSCGKIQNISSPFRLKGDPKVCGDRRLELTCENNITTVLNLFSGKFHVQHINYTGHTIRVTDAGLEDDTCSSIPRYFLYEWNFSDSYAERISGDPLTPNTNTTIAFLNCSNPVIGDPQYLGFNSTGAASFNRQHSGGYIYAILGNNRNVYGRKSVNSIKVGCYLQVATYTSWTKDSDICKSLVYGFELSWLHIICQEHCGRGIPCIVNDSTGQVQCNKPYCPNGYPTPDQCGMLPQILAYTRAYLKGILYGIYSAITSPLPNDLSPQLPFQSDFYWAEFIGRYIVSSIVAVRFLFGLTLLIVLLTYKWRRRHLSVYANIESFLQDSNLNPIRYSYKEIKQMTRGFKVKLGEGGFGSVYKGKLRSGPSVAIKMLNNSKSNDQDFINEVATIGKVHHVNVVRLIGYCVEGKKSALVYEFMSNGSLDKHIFSKEGTIPLNYEKTFEIALGVARGIAYLHQGCDMQILHFDIKPHNILLDDNLLPKVSDFGLAKLYPVDCSIISLRSVKGTPGYIAPELLYKNIGGVSYKADVYSFGMLLMEMANKQRNWNSTAENSSDGFIPTLIFEQLKEGKEIEMANCSKEEKKVAKKMILVALWCIQFKPSDRPSMNKVVDMLEREVESLEIPPQLSLYPQRTVEEDHQINSGCTASSNSILSGNYLGEGATDPLIENSS